MWAWETVPGREQTPRHVAGGSVGEAGAGEGALREAYLQPSVAKVMNKLVRPSACKAKGYMGHIVTPFL